MLELAESEQEQHVASQTYIHALIEMGNIKEAESLVQIRLKEVEVKLSKGRGNDAGLLYVNANLHFHLGLCGHKRGAPGLALFEYLIVKDLFDREELAQQMLMYQSLPEDVKQEAALYKDVAF